LSFGISVGVLNNGCGERIAKVGVLNQEDVGELSRD
jgi:hypothetical protein